MSCGGAPRGCPSGSSRSAPAPGIPPATRSEPAIDVFQDLALSACASADGERIASCAADGTVACYRAKDGRRAWRSRLHTDHVCGLAFTPDGRLLVTASRDHSAKVYDARTGELWTSYTRHTQTLPNQAMYQHAVLCVATGPRAEQVVTAGEGGELHVWEPELYRAEDGTAAQMETRFEAKSHVRKVVLAGGDVLAVAVGDAAIYAGTRAGLLYALDSELGTRTLLDLPGDSIFTVALAPGGALLAAGTRSGKVYVIELAQGIEVEAPQRGVDAPRFWVQP